MTEYSMRISAQGQLLFVYGDEHLEDLGVLGTMELVRASTVTWDAEAQKWAVTFKVPLLNQGAIQEMEVMADKKFLKRQDAIEFEVRQLNKALADGINPEQLFTG